MIQTNISERITIRFVCMFSEFTSFVWQLYFRNSSDSSDRLVNHTYVCFFPGEFKTHDDIINGNIFRVTGPLNSPHKGQWRVALMFSLICAWINGWVNNFEAGDLRRHRAHYYVSVMQRNKWPLRRHSLRHTTSYLKNTSQTARLALIVLVSL